LSSFNKSDKTYVPDAPDIRAKRLRFTICRLATLLQEETREKRLRRKVAMLTLTYRPDVVWEPGHIAMLIENITRFARYHFGGPIPYEWVAETTKAGKLHYHVALWIPRGKTLPMPDKRGWWPHGMTRIEWAKFAPGYLAKYVVKGISACHLKTLPKGVRLFGYGGVSKDMKAQLRFEKLPEWIKTEAKASLAHDVHRSSLRGASHVARASGELLVSPWGLRRMTRQGPELVRIGVVHPLAPV